MVLSLTHDYDSSLTVAYAGQDLLRYVYMPTDAQRESPRPYFHPLRTLDGDVVSLYRPHDHVWHKGIALSLPNVGPANFWGGVTYVRDRGYVQLPNNGAMVHRGFDVLDRQDSVVRTTHSLDWVTQDGETWVTEVRSFAVTVHPDSSAWVLSFSTAFTNVSDADVAIGSPTTEGRDNAGYGGLFWRGPRSFTGGTIYTPSGAGSDELMGQRFPWMGLAGRHDESDRSSTILFVDAPDNADHPVQWFVRATPFAALCPAPFFAKETIATPGATITLRYAIVVACGDPGPEGAVELAALGQAAL
jgi:hypothetical protein